MKLHIRGQQCDVFTKEGNLDRGENQGMIHEAFQDLEVSKNGKEKNKRIEAVASESGSVTRCPVNQFNSFYFIFYFVNCLFLFFPSGKEQSNSLSAADS